MEAEGVSSMVDLDEIALAKLAREMAMNIRPALAIFEDFGIAAEDYYEIQKIEFFKRAKEQFALEWNSALSVNERVKLISAAYVEEGLPTVGRRMLKETEKLPDVVEAMKLLSRNAGLGEPKPSGPQGGERFVITINLGEETETYDKSITIDANDIPNSANSRKIPQIEHDDRAHELALKALLDHAP